MKSRGLEEIPVFDISEKTNGIETKSPSSDEERLASGMFYQSETVLFTRSADYLDLFFVIIVVKYMKKTINLTSNIFSCFLLIVGFYSIKVPNKNVN